MTKITSNFDEIHPGMWFNVTWDPTPNPVTISLMAYNNVVNDAAVMQSTPIGPANMKGETGWFGWTIPSKMPTQYRYEMSIAEAGSKGYSRTNFYITPQASSEDDVLTKTETATPPPLSVTVMVDTPMPVTSSSGSTLTSILPTSTSTVLSAPSTNQTPTTSSTATVLTNQITRTPVINTSPSPPTTTSKARETLGPGTKAGIGIGVSMGAIAVIALAFLLYRSRKLVLKKMDGILGTTRNPEFGEISTSALPHTETYYGAGESVETPSNGGKKGLFK